MWRGRPGRSCWGVPPQQLRGQDARATAGETPALPSSASPYFAIHSKSAGGVVTQKRGEKPDEMQARKKKYVVLAAMVLAASGILGAKISEGQATGVYEIDAKASRIEIHVYRTGALSGLGDDHHIQLTRFSGAASREEGEPWQVHVVGEAA